MIADQVNHSVYMQQRDDGDESGAVHTCGGKMFGETRP